MNIIVSSGRQLRLVLAGLFIVSLTFISSQTLTPGNIKNINVSGLSNEDVLRIKSEMEKTNMSMPTLENMALSNGMTATDFSILKTKIENVSPTVAVSTVELGTTIDEKPIQLDQVSDINKSEIFGSEIFNNNSLSFEPNPNMASPANYILGPGDELQIVVYGMQEFSASPTVSKEGKISLPIVGQIFVNGLTFEAAKVLIKKACGRIYTSLNSGQSTLSVSLGKIRTIRVTIIGAKNPGNYSVSSLSTVFNALHIAGGPDANGTYRKIELIRNNKVIRTVDIYKFITTGNQSDNVNLQENDVIRIPVYENRVKIEGKVKKPGIFELLPTENFLDLLEYCSGFDESAYRSNIKLIQNTEKELKIYDLSEEDYKNYKPRSGDVFKVSTLLDRIENKVSIKGSVFRPDDYAFEEGMTLQDLVNKADGFTEDVFESRALLIRQKEDLTKEILNFKLTDNLAGIKLKKNDEVVVSSIFDFKTAQNVEIKGYVNNPGVFPYVERLTLYDLIIEAGGFVPGSSRVVEIARTIIKDEALKSQKEKSQVFNLEIDTLLVDEAKNFILQPYDIVNIRKKPVFEIQENVFVKGEAVYPGSYTLTNANETFMDVINRSGGLKDEANIQAIYVIRKTDDLEADGVQKIDRIIPIDFKKVSRNPKSKMNIILKPNDEIVINKLDYTVKILGAVYLRSEIPYNSGKSIRYYKNSVGGYSGNANKDGIYVVYPNGLAKATKHFWFFRNYPKVEIGSQVVVPVKTPEPPNPNKLTITELAVISGVVGSLTTMTIAIITLLK